MGGRMPRHTIFCLLGSSLHPLANFTFCVKTVGLGANKLPTSDGSVLAEGRFLETLMFPAWEEGVFRTACHSFRLHLEVVQRMPRKGETHGPSPLLRVILCGLPLQVCSEVWCKLSGLAGLLDCGLMSLLGYSFEGRCALW